MPLLQYIKGNLTVDGTITNNGSVVGGGLKGPQALVPLAVGEAVCAAITTLSSSGTAMTSARMYAHPFTPNQTFTSSNLYINCSTAIASALARILIYSDSNGKPGTKLYESASLDLSTLGSKTATTSFTFTAGTTYWLTVHSSSNASVNSLQLGQTLLIKSSSTSQINHYTANAAFPSAPTNFTSPSEQSAAFPAVFITKAS